MSAKRRPWLFCQLGAREHYVLPRGFHRQGRLRALITDAWAPPQSLLAHAPGRLGRRLIERYSPDLADATVEHFTGSAIGFDLVARLGPRAPSRWSTIMRRNEWFERNAVKRMAERRLLEGSPVVFAYSYAALGILRAARASGCPTVLGQIDPGITEEDIVADAVSRHAALKPDWTRAPPAYWTRWRKECEIADRIIVNSSWAREGLVQAGVDPAKLVVIPLAYEGPASAVSRDIPARFSGERPLRILFLGSVVIRKGVAELLDAARLLADAPVEFHFVGAESITFPADVIANPRIVRHGAVSRREVAAHYAAADVFILPSLSDGFGLTQIEAQAYGLPVIASRHCGEVVSDGVNGLLLDEVSGAEMAAKIRRYLGHPELVRDHSRQLIANLNRFSATLVGEQFNALVC
jgi:hypothetical protein